MTIDERLADLGHVLDRLSHDHRRARLVERRLNRRRLVFGLAAIGVAASAAAWSTREDGDIAWIPEDTAIMSGESIDGTDWWLLPAAPPLPNCPDNSAGAFFVSEALNKPGQEWNMGGLCESHASWLVDPSLFDMGRMRLGSDDDVESSWGFYLATHPEVVLIRVSIDGSESTIPTVPLPDRPDSGRYAAFTAPSDASMVRVQLIGIDDVVIASRIIELNA